MNYNLYDASNQLIEDASSTKEYFDEIAGKEMVIGDDNTIGNSFVYWEAEHTNQYFLTPVINVTTDFYLKAISSSGEEVQSSKITIEL